MANLKQQILPEVLRSRDSATFTGSYQTLGTPLVNPCRLVKIVNDSDQDILISWDGTNDHDYVPAQSFALYDFTTNKSGDTPLSVSAQTQFYVQGSSGTGLVYLAAFYAN